LYPLCPCYLIAGSANGRTRVDCSVGIAAAARRGARLVFDVARAEGNIIETSAVDASVGETLGCDLSVPVQQPADFTITARLLDSGGKQLATAQTDLHVIPREESR